MDDQLKDLDNVIKPDKPASSDKPSSDNTTASDDKVKANWRDQLPEDLRESGELKTLGSVEELAKSYINMSKLNSTKIPFVDKDDSWENLITKSKNFFKIPSELDEYKLEQYDGKDSEFVRKLGHKLAMHPRQTVQFIKQYQDAQTAEIRGLRDLRKQEWDKQAEAEMSKLAAPDEVLARGANRINMRLDVLKQDLGDHFHHPAVKKMLSTIGKEKQISDIDKSLDHTKSAHKGNSIDDDLAYVKMYLSDNNSAYFKNVDGHSTEIRAKVDQAIKRLSEHEKKTGKPLGLF